MSEALSIQSLRDDVAADVEPEDLPRPLLGLVRVGGELDPAGLPAPAGEHLRLDDDGAAEHLGRLPRLARASSRAVRPTRGSRRAGRAPCPGTRRGPPDGEHSDGRRRIDRYSARLACRPCSGRSPARRWVVSCAGARSENGNRGSPGRGCGARRRLQRRVAPDLPTEAAPPQAAELGWTEQLPKRDARWSSACTGSPSPERGWEADVEVENQTDVMWEIPGALSAVTTSFGVMLFRTGELEELDRGTGRRSAGSPRGGRLRAGAPDSLAPGEGGAGRSPPAAPSRRACTSGSCSGCSPRRATRRRGSTPRSPGSPIMRTVYSG